MDEKEFYLEVKGNHMDYEMLKKYTDYLSLFNLKMQYTVSAILCFILDMIIGINLGIMNINNLFIGIFIPVFICIITYLISHSTKMKKSIIFIKEVHGVDEMNYNLLFNDYSFKVETDGISKEFKYSKIKRVIRIDGGIFIWITGLYFVFCDFSKMDTESQEVLLKRLRKEPKIKWIDKRVN